MNDKNEKTIKEPWLSVFLSALLPGVGQIYGGKVLRGIIFIFVYALLSLIGITGIVGFIFLEDAAISRLFILTTIISILIILIFSIYILFDAYKAAKTYNVNQQINIDKDNKKKTWLAVFLTYLFSGIGQFYNKQIIKGCAFLITAIILYIIADKYYIFQILLFPLYLFAMKDAFVSAERINGAERKFLDQEKRAVKAFILAMLLFHLIPFGQITKTHFIQAFKIPAGSMLPTIEIGDHIFVDKITHAKGIKRGEIIVFAFPEDERKDFIKRVIGLPGEGIEIRDKEVYINDEKLTENYIIHQDQHIKPKEYEPRDNMGTITIPSDSLFVMGDNRDQSYDSRYWGFVKTDKVKGKVIKIYWSWDSKNKEVRWNRIGMRVK